ncbi:PLP-dependent aminotransferase family protein [Acetobacter sp. TBRC 12305]|uniref:PLP-dependent aminotransferase family protein n=1 Tax=Acetobacter garciniae TaxID=2817435 RepID=A0A939KNU5_9PROT|nr:PLP-dependent aminotransferase family protein [Acetobacter garciniae]MBO1326768.1 PLP-dependent aminotransferase family protein [Acetobacter garciniae]MBX0346520.1 PLP-dependent aminotransferase family protein [Acetobacter garciniae]
MTGQRHRAAGRRTAKKTIRNCVYVDRTVQTPLVAQIIRQVIASIENNTWPEHARLPSIRRMAAHCAVSTLTVANAYNKLVADGFLEVQAARGYFVATRPVLATPAPVGGNVKPSVDSLWLLQRIYEEQSQTLNAGCGWLPPAYLYTDGIRHAATALARKPDPEIFSYGNPYGHRGLREQIQALLLRDDVPCDLSSIIVTHGASQAIELAARALARPGDTVVVEEPGYCNLFPALAALGLNMVGVPRLQQGPCLESLRKVFEDYQPCFFFINTRIHNPTGTSCSPYVSHHILSLCEQFGVFVIEDDTFGALDDENSPILAQLDRLQRVVHIGSFSKTISPGMRVGYMACPPAIAASVLRLKMASSLTSSSFSETVIHHIMSDGQFRLHQTRLKERLKERRRRISAALEANGFTLYARPRGGMFLWARAPERVDVQSLAEKALERGILLAPGAYFNPGHSPSSYLRFNVAYSGDERLHDFLSTA